MDFSGVVRAVLIVGLDLGRLNRLVAQARLVEGSVVGMIDRNGTIVARYPDPERWVGEPALAQNEGVLEATSPDGVPRLYGFTSLKDRTQSVGVYVWVGIPKAVARAEPRRLLARNLTGLGLAAGLTLVAAWA